MAAPEQDKARKIGDRASVIFKKKPKPAKKPSGGGGCFDGCFSWLMGYPKGGEKAGIDYSHPQELEPIQLCENWVDLGTERKSKVKFVEIHSGAKEGVSGWNNQDSTAACASPFSHDRDRAFIFCVFDGHGSNGHEVARLAQERLPAHLAAFPGGALSSPQMALEQAFRKTDDDIYKAMGEEVEYSGSTGVAVLMDADRRVLHVGNVGDSRAVLGQLIGTEAKAMALTEDLKPALPEERSRIEAHGGHIGPMVYEGQDVGVDRVWESAARKKPGLAVSRSLGDGAARILGVTADPIVTKHQLGAQDRFMLIATDGLWDSLGNDQAVQMASKYLDRNLPQVALKALTEAVRREEGGELADDTTTVIVVF